VSTRIRNIDSTKRVLAIAFVFDPEHLLVAGDDRAAGVFASFLPRARNSASSHRQTGVTPAWKQMSRTMRSQEFLRVGSDQLNEFTRCPTLSSAIMVDPFGAPANGPGGDLRACENKSE
jgi:hypothetical protein